uniref:G-protein coupled receptors family 1 profile domain-containing protein n=1 Tax=Ciona savignyi TaxID=51511 RepID=H2YWK1_CIOSA
MEGNITNSSLNQIANFRYIGIAIGVVDIILGTLGNLLTIVVLARISTLQSSFNIFITSLAVVDLLTAALMMPFNVAGYAQMDWSLGGAESITASIQAFVYFCCGYTSITCFVLITTNRYISVMLPTHYKTLFSKSRIIGAVIISWMVAPAFLLPVLLGRGADGRPIIGWHRDQLLCTFINVTGNWRSYMQVLRVLFQFLPIFAMVVMYAMMLWRFRRQVANVENPTLPWEKQNNGSEGAELMEM